MMPVLLIVIPLLAAFLAVLFKRLGKFWLLAGTSANLAYLAYMLWQYTEPVMSTIGGFQPPFGIALVMDEYALLGVILMNVVFTLSIALSCKYAKKYEVVLLVSLAALNGVILTGDLFNLFVFLEIAAIAAYILTTANKSLKHTFHYLVLGTLASGLFLFGIVILYNMFGSLNIQHIQGLMMAQSAPIAATLLLPMLLIFAGLSVEAKILPFSGWVKGILKNSNPLVGTLITSAYATAMLLVFGRLIQTIFVLSEGMRLALTLIGVVTLSLAEFAAFSKRNLRQILLFSSIAQSGLVVALFMQGLTNAALLILVNNVVSKLVLFSMAAKMAADTGSDHIDDLKGVFVKNKLLGVGFTVAAMSLIGLPFFYGFTAKATTLMALFDAGNLWLPIVILLVSVVEGAYVIRILSTLWNTGNEGELASADQVKPYNLSNKFATGLIVSFVGLLILAAGILPLLHLDRLFDTDLLSFLFLLIGGGIV